MTVNVAVGGHPRALPIVHELVCSRCGHGESLHPLRELACLACDQRASAGLPSRFCVGFLEDRPAPATARALS